MQSSKIRMLTEMIEYSCKIKEVKSIRSEIKENIQGANSEGKERKLGLKSMIWNKRKK